MRWQDELTFDKRKKQTKNGFVCLCAAACTGGADENRVRAPEGGEQASEGGKEVNLGPPRNGAGNGAGEGLGGRLEGATFGTTLNGYGYPGIICTCCPSVKGVPGTGSVTGVTGGTPTPGTIVNPGPICGVHGVTANPAPFANICPNGSGVAGCNTCPGGGPRGVLAVHNGGSPAGPNG